MNQSFIAIKEFEKASDANIYKCEASGFVVSKTVPKNSMASTVMKNL